MSSLCGNGKHKVFSGIEAKVIGFSGSRESMHVLFCTVPEPDLIGSLLLEKTWIFKLELQSVKDP